MPETDERAAEACLTYFSAQSKILFPLDLSGRIEWLRACADHTASAVERTTILALIERTRNGEVS